MHPREREQRIIRASKPAQCPIQYHLTPGQRTAVDMMLDFEAGPRETLLLTGHAGTGKTTAVAAFLQASPTHARGGCVLVAPTNKAVRVLCETAGKLGVTVPCMTVHRLLGLVLQKDSEQKYCARGRESLLPELVVVDECSMIGNGVRGKEDAGLFDRLMLAAHNSGSRVLFVGDPNQLPPVKELDSPTFATEYRYQLTEIVRQAAESPIIQLADWLRRVLEGQECGSSPEPRLVDGHGVHRVASRAAYESLVVEHYRAAEGLGPRAVAWRWKTIDPFARQVRDALYPGAGAYYVPGVRYFTTEPVVNLNAAGGEIPFHLITDEDAVLRGVEACVHPYRNFGEYKALRVTFEKDDGECFKTYVVHPDEEWEFKRAVQEMRRECRRTQRGWMRLWECADAFNWDADPDRMTSRFKAYYVTTVHRSQGSTYDSVFVDYQDISVMQDRRERLRCLYTACTRGAKDLFVLE